MAKSDKHLYPSVHRGIVIAAVQALSIAEHPAAKRYSVGDLETMTAEAAQPDVRGDRQQGRGRHYYCAVSPKGAARAKDPCTGGYRNGRHAAAPSPLSMLEGEYRMALALHRAGKFYPAMQSLARAMHMLADVCCPPHSCGLTYFSRYGLVHKRYEANAAELFWGGKVFQSEEYNAAMKWAEEAAENIPFELYTGLWQYSVPRGDGSWRLSRFTQICNQLAESGAAELEKVFSSDRADRDESAHRRIVLSVQHCAALLAAFDRDLTDASLPVWSVYQPYWLCAPAAKLCVSREPLYLHFEENGAVSLATAEGACLTVSPAFGVVSLRDPDEESRITFRIGFEPLLTLYPGGDQSRLLTLSHRLLLCRSRRSFARESDLMRAAGFVLRREPPRRCRFLLSEKAQTDEA